MKLKSLIKERVNEIGIMRRSFPKLEEDSGLGADFDRAQQSYDAQMPPEDEPEMECPTCSSDSGKITKKYKSGKYYSWEAKCDSCGYEWGNDNFQ